MFHHIARLTICEAIRIIQKDVTDVGFRSVIVLWIRGIPNTICGKSGWTCSVLCMKTVDTEHAAAIVTVPILDHKPFLPTYRSIHKARIGGQTTRGIGNSNRKGTASPGIGARRPVVSFIAIGTDVVRICIRGCAEKDSGRIISNVSCIQTHCHEHVRFRHTTESTAGVYVEIVL